MNRSFLQNNFSKPMRYTWYDLETTGTNTFVDQPLQACVIETDGDLNILTDNKGQEMIHDFKILLRPDIVPAPEAFMVHKINPLDLYGKTSDNLVSEYDMAERMRSIFLRTQNTCIAGFNNIGYDDEMIRHTNFRNLVDPYEHEWKTSNHRTDVYMLAMITRLYSESIINWHTKEDGTVSLKLEHICKANGINHGSSHDAKNDVLDTIEIAKLIKDRRPELFARFKQMSDKKYIQGLLRNQQVLVTTSKYLPKSQYNTTMVLPIGSDPANANRYYGVDLTKDITFLLNGTPDEIGYELFTKNTDKTHAPIETGIQTITANKLPILTTPMPKQGEPSDAGYQRVAEKIGIDYDLVRNNEELVRKFFPQIKKTISTIFDRPPREEVRDVFVSLYSGKFLTDAEKSLRERQRLPASHNNNHTYLTAEPIVDKFRSFKENMNVHAEIMLRTKWNTFFRELLSKDNIDNIDPNELLVYRNYLKKALFDKNSELGITVDEYHQRVGNVKIEWDLTEDDFKILDNLDKHVERVVSLYEYIDNKCSQVLELAGEMRRERPLDYDKCFSQTFSQQTFDKTARMTEQDHTHS